MLLFDCRPNLEKCYKSIAVESGDTLWEIAAEFKGSHYESAQAYIDEVMWMNHLETDQIHAGQYLTVPYYVNDYDDNPDERVKNSNYFISGIK